ncbi:response regulator transcription factor [Limnohabitans sp. Hippo4]|uniref:response regulator transcription factor n=1 Tax=Limnohabitans sp. Hippo4 TaxID=1826167 RepID=UPI001304F5A0|nr:response regulator transcription factor [Limnohabitans sp. Hippo4]
MLLDDEDDLREEVASFLKISGAYEVVQVATIRQFYQYFKSSSYDMVILDAALPDGDGFDVAREVLNHHPNCGVVMFTAKDSTRDRINGYGMGVDHYVTKPIRMDELLAILQSLERRICQTKVWQLNKAEWALRSPSGVLIPVSALEYKFLTILNVKSGASVSRRHIIEQLGKDSVSYDDRNLDALVLRLRRKVRTQTIEDFPLKTIHGSGYTLTMALIEL